MDLSSLWEDDLYRSQSLHQAHRAVTTSALPERRLTGRRCGWGLLSEEQTTVWKPVAASSVGEPAEVANAGEALRQDVLGKAAQKLLTRKSQGTSLVMMGVVFPAEGHLGRADREEAMVGNGHAMGIASEIMQDVLGSAKRRLRVDDPVLLKQGAQEGAKRLGVSKRQAVPVERQLLVAKGTSQSRYELAAKDTAEHLYG